MLAVRDLAVSFAQRSGEANGVHARTRAVTNVSMTIYPSQTLAVVGESGCGKSVTALSLMHLLPRSSARIDRGTASYRTGNAQEPIDLYSLSEREMRRIRGGQIAMIFQEPMSSLNPVLSIGEQIIEAIHLHRRAGAREARAIAIDALDTVGMTNATGRLAAYPHQFSGGMRQRVMIAMALACRPRLLLADEPTTALDATIQRQILDLLRNLQSSAGMAVMLVTHDLGIVRDRADVVCVMYAGRVVEYARTDDLFRTPRHPYTRALLACVPGLETRSRRLTTIAEMAKNGDFLHMPRPTTQNSSEATTPWWPADPSEPGPPSSLVELVPEHWVAVAGQGPVSGAYPDLAPRLPQSV